LNGVNEHGSKIPLTGPPHRTRQSHGRRAWTCGSYLAGGQETFTGTLVRRGEERLNCQFSSVNGPYTGSSGGLASSTFRFLQRAGTKIVFIGCRAPGSGLGTGNWHQRAGERYGRGAFVRLYVDGSKFGWQTGRIITNPITNLRTATDQRPLSWTSPTINQGVKHLAHDPTYFKGAHLTRAGFFCYAGL